MRLIITLFWQLILLPYLAVASARRAGDIPTDAPGRYCSGRVVGAGGREVRRGNNGMGLGGLRLGSGWVGVWDEQGRDAMGLEWGISGV